MAVNFMFDEMFDEITNRGGTKSTKWDKMEMLFEFCQQYLHDSIFYYQATHTSSIRLQSQLKQQQQFHQALNTKLTARIVKKRFKRLSKPLEEVALVEDYLTHQLGNREQEIFACLFPDRNHSI